MRMLVLPAAQACAQHATLFDFAWGAVGLAALIYAAWMRLSIRRGSRRHDAAMEDLHLGVGAATEMRP